MLKCLRAKHPVGFCVLSEVLFLGSLLLASYLQYEAGQDGMVL